MRVETTAGDIAKATRCALNAQNTKIRIPILAENLLLRATEDGSISAFVHALDACKTVMIAGTVIEPGAAVVSVRLAKVLAALAPDAAVTLETVEGAISLHSARSRYRIPALPETDYPAPLAVGKTALEFTPTSDERHALLTRPAPAICSELTRYYLTGTSLKAIADRLEACATTGHVLILTSIPAPSGDLAILKNGIIVPAAAGRKIAKLNGAIRLGNGIIEAHGKGVTYASKLVDAQFPDYARVIPKPSLNTAEIDCAELIGALTRLVALGDGGAIRIVWEKDSDAITLTLPRTPGDNRDVLPATTRGAGHTAGSPKLLLDLIEPLGTETITLDAADPASPVRISTESEPDTLMIWMPISAHNPDRGD
jgi:DNA polymerase-3 subunit beta